MDRRAFVASGAIACEGVALPGIAGVALADEAAAAEVQADKQADLVILGGGLSGVIAAYAAVQAGASVVLVEVGAELGGTLLISGGGMHTQIIETPEEVADFAPTGDRALLERYMREWVDFRDTWLAETGAPQFVHNPLPGWNTITIGSDYATRKEFIDFFGDAVVSAGSEVMLNSRGIELMTDSSGAVCGAVVADEQGGLTRVAGKAVILATGGWGADPVMREAFLGAFGDQLVTRTVPYNRGDGHRMALALGAQLTRGMGQFYGHLTPYPGLLPLDKASYDAASKDDLCALFASVQTFEPLGITVNMDGLRFADENSTNILFAGMDCWIAQRIADQPLGVGYVIVDSSVSGIADTMASLAAMGAVVDTADTIEGLAEALAAHGVNAAGVVRTVRAYNESDPSELAIPQSKRLSGDAGPIEQAPFYALQVTGACSAMFGGLKIDEDARVLGKGDLPITGLYATPCCAGGFFYNEYVGSIALSAVYGRVAAQTALADMGA